MNWTASVLLLVTVQSAVQELEQPGADEKAFVEGILPLFNEVETDRSGFVRAAGLSSPDAGVLRRLSKFTRLQKLLIRSSTFPDEKIFELSKCLGLRSLSFLETPINDKALKQLTELSQLRSLDLINTKVTDSGLLHLQQCGQLKSLIMVLLRSLWVRA